MADMAKAIASAVTWPITAPTRMIIKEYNDINVATLSGAIDVIVVRQPDGSLKSTPFHVRFGKLEILKPADKMIRIQVNGADTPLRMKLGRAGEAYFVEESNLVDNLPSELTTSPIMSPRRHSAVITPPSDGEMAAEMKAVDQIRTHLDSLEIPTDEQGLAIRAAEGRDVSPEPEPEAADGGHSKLKESSTSASWRWGWGDAVPRRASSVDDSPGSTTTSPLVGAVSASVSGNSPTPLHIGAAAAPNMWLHEDGVPQVQPLDLVGGSGRSRSPSPPLCSPMSTPIPRGAEEPPEVEAVFPLSKSSSDGIPDVNGSFGNEELEPEPEEEAESRVQNMLMHRMRSDSQYFDAERGSNSRSASDRNMRVRSSTESDVSTMMPGGLDVQLSLCGDQLADTIVRDMKAASTTAAGAPAAVKVKDDAGSTGRTPEEDYEAIFAQHVVTPAAYAEAAAAGSAWVMLNDSRLMVRFGPGSMHVLAQGGAGLKIKGGGALVPGSVAVPYLLGTLTFGDQLPLSTFQPPADLSPTAASGLDGEAAAAKPSSPPAAGADAQPAAIPEPRSFWGSSWWGSTSKVAAQKAAAAQAETERKKEHARSLGLQAESVTSWQPPSEDASPAATAAAAAEGPGVVAATAVAAAAAAAADDKDGLKDGFKDVRGGGNPPLTPRQFVKSVKPSSEALESLLLVPGMNTVRFRAVSVGVEVSARVYLWDYQDKIVISDVDGTITKSDVMGHIMTFVGGDWSHAGVAKLYSAVEKNGYKMMYLTSRAIGMATSTRSYISGLAQDGITLPQGPVIMSPDRLFESLAREVVYRRPQEFKIAALTDIRSLFNDLQGSGQVSPTSPTAAAAMRNQTTPFYAGFGNRPTDAQSYGEVGVPSGKIFIINEKSEVTSQRGVKLLGFREDVAPSSSGEKATGKGKAAKGKAAKPSGYNSILEIADNIFPPLTHRDLTSCLSPSSPFARSSSEPAGEDIEAGGGIASGGGGGGGGGSGDGGGEVGTAGDLLPDGSPLSPNGRQQPSNHSVLPEPEVAHEDYNSFNYWRAPVWDLPALPGAKQSPADPD